MNSCFKRHGHKPLKKKQALLYAHIGFMTVHTKLLLSSIL